MFNGETYALSCSIAVISFVEIIHVSHCPTYCCVLRSDRNVKKLYPIDSANLKCKKEGETIILENGPTEH
jgi:hypothetical protein